MLIKIITEVICIYILLCVTIGRRTLWRVSPLYRKLLYPWIFIYIFIHVDKDIVKKMEKLPDTSIRRSILEALYEEESL